MTQAPTPHPAPYRVCLMGVSVTTRNRGVAALASSVVRLIQEARPEASFSYLIGHHRPETITVDTPAGPTPVRVVNCRMSPKSSPREHLAWILFAALVHRFLPLPPLRRALVRRTPWLRALAEADLVGDIRGGDSFSDIYGLGKLVMGSIPSLTALLLDKRLILLPQTYGPYKSRLARGLARWTIRHSHTVLSRDREGLEIATQLAGPERAADRVRFCPDVAFALAPHTVESPHIDPPLEAAATAPLIGLNVNGLMFNGGYTRSNMFGLSLDYPELVHQLLARLMLDTPARVLLVPHTFGAPGDVNSDPDACRAVLDRLPPGDRARAHLVTHAYDQHDIKGIIGLCDFFIGSRMHSCIAALSQGIPTVGIAYSRKFKGVFESVGAGHMIVDAREMDNPAAIERTLALFQARAKSAPAIEQSAKDIRATLKGVFATLTATTPDQSGP